MCSVSLFGTGYAQTGQGDAINSLKGDKEFNGYVVVLESPGLMYYEGDIPGLRATAISATGHGKLDVTTRASVAYRRYLEQQHNALISRLSSALQRSLGDVYRYDIALSGLGIRLAASEVSAVERMPGVESVNIVRDQRLDTYRGPSFIGADAIWSGSATPNNAASRGNGIVVGVIDSGVNRLHPSFAALPAECGAEAGQSKLVALTCLSGGVCGPGAPGATCQNNNNGTPEDCVGHGSHTASTAAGNTLSANGMAPAPAVDISGVATCAKVRSYKVCNSNLCDPLAIMAAIDRAIADGVDVINFSIGGGGGVGSDIWTPGATSDRLFLDALNAGILVAASAGNTREDNLTPEGDVNHRGPWLTTVAASSHDEIFSLPGSLKVTGPGNVPANLIAPITLTSSNSPLDIAPNSPLLLRAFPAAPNGCDADPAYPANYFAGGTALVSRGVCPFAEKVAKAVAASATSVIVYNNAPGVIDMGGLENATVPAYSILQSAGQALTAFAASLGGQPIQANGQPPKAQGDVLANFSLRGPINPVPNGAQGSANAFDVTKPDITAPGVSIYAAVNTPGNYGALSGTSMASPHVAGGYALMRAVRPDWSATEIKSALMMTAFNGGTQENGTTPWNADDVGSGRADLTKAALSGLVMDESFANFVASNPNNGGHPATLNLPSMRDTNCTPACTWTRTVKSTLAGNVNWTASIAAPPGFSVTIAPTVFTTKNPGDEHLLIITAIANPGESGTALKFGQIKLDAGNASPPLHLPIVVRGKPN